MTSSYTIRAFDIFSNEKANQYTRVESLLGGKEFINKPETLA